MFCVGIPTLCRYDILKISLERYATDFAGIEFFIVDNGKQNIQPPNKYFRVLEQENNLGVAASWNLICAKGFKNYDYVVVLNDDIYLGYDKSFIIDAIKSYPYSLIRSYVSWSMFIMSKYTYTNVGKFDEIFYPAYYEDSDYIYRMKLLGQEQVIIENLTPKNYIISGTYEIKPDLVNEAMQINKERYIEKWGNLPLLEKFLTPYNK
jgi:GT2 family glycosyltransferase